MKTKRLMILGGQLKMCDIVSRAKELGCYTVVTDWYEDSPAKKLADKAYMVSTSDVDAVCELIKKESIDGVITGFIDSTLPYYYEICQKAGLPCYLNQAVLDACTNKRRFKEACRKVGIRTIPEVDISDPAKLDYPILIKPADNSGSKGITVCSDEGMVSGAYDRAMRFSRSKSVLTEKFMDCDYVCAHYVVQNGKAELALLMDKDMNRMGRGTVPYPTAFVSPSRYRGDYLERIHPTVQRLVDFLQYKNGTFLISFFVSGRNYYAVEMSARLTASREYLFIRDDSGTDTLEMYIHHALTGEFSCESRGKEKEETALYCMLFVFVKDGIIGKTDGFDEVREIPGVLNVLQLRDIGASIRADGSYGQIFARIHLKAGSRKEMVKLVREVRNRIRVYSTDDEPMLIDGFDAGRFFS